MIRVRVWKSETRFWTTLMWCWCVTDCDASCGDQHKQHKSKKSKTVRATAATAKQPGFPMSWLRELLLVAGPKLRSPLQTTKEANEQTNWNAKCQLCQLLSHSVMICLRIVQATRLRHISHFRMKDFGEERSKLHLHSSISTSQGRCQLLPPLWATSVRGAEQIWTVYL